MVIKCFKVLVIHFLWFQNICYALKKKIHFEKDLIGYYRIVFG